MKNWYRDQIAHYESSDSYFRIYSPGKESLHVNQEFNRFIDFLRIPENSKILEVGCGDGRFTKYLLHRGYKVTALDLSENIIDRIRQGIKGSQYEQNLKLYVGNLEKLPFPENTFDACVCVHVLHHTENIEKSVGEMARVIKKSGIVGFIEPNPYCPYWYFFIPICRCRKWAIEKGLIRCSGKKLQKIMERAGLSSIDRKKFGFIPSAIMKNNKFLARIEMILGETPIFNNLAGAHFFRGIKK
ncbi:MAG: class I SAM-dependent methyltransferase [Nanoarchaeota archaeon]|nr:class I SAM-dependent methyltransferase [Nanoarchaeota archaeon]